jgi:DNA processing protein
VSRGTRPTSDLVARLRLARTDGVGPVTYRLLLGRFGSAAAALDALPGLIRDAGRTEKTIPPVAAIEDEIAGLARLGATLLMAHMPDYPPLLAMLADPPPALSVLGDVSLLAKRAVAIVGGRQAPSTASTSPPTSRRHWRRPVSPSSPARRGAWTPPRMRRR